MYYTAMRMSPEDRAYLDERYGLKAKKRWPLFVVTIVVAGLAAWFSWAYWAQIHPKITSGETSFALNVSKTPAHCTTNCTAWQSTVTYQVRRANKSVQPTCTAQVLGEGQAIIGQLSVNPFEGSTATVRTVVSSISSYRPALAINWVGCTATGQNSPQ